ncbi:MAG: cytochrome c3 family protein [Myxococcales bacterium]
MIALVALLLLAAPADESKYPAPLREFLSAKNKDGSPVLSENDRKTLAAFPDHTRNLLGAAADSVILGSAAHLKILLSLELAPAAMEIVAQDNCILCHSDPGNQKAKHLFSTDPAARHANPLLNLKEFVSDVHFRRGLSCSGCHGGKPSDEMMTKDIAARWPAEEARHSDRSWIPGFCAKCHEDAAFMRGFNPTLPTDQLVKYKGSQHGILLLQQKDSRAAQCVSCHGLHGIRNAKSRQSTVHVQRIPDTCGSCHSDPKRMEGYRLPDGKPLPTTQVAQYKASVHGKALLEKGDLGAPACTGCHGSHAAMPPAVASVAQICRRCHAQNGMLFDGSRHKTAFEQHKWPECETCHGKHGITKPTDALVGNTPGTLCHDCHSQYAEGNQQCDATAASFRTALDALVAGRADIEGPVERFAERGLDVEPLSRTISELDEALVQTRSKVHTFDLSSFQAAAQPGNEAVVKGRELIAQTRREAGFRSRGLLAAIGFMALIAAGIALKLREIGKRRIT